MDVLQSQVRDLEKSVNNLMENSVLVPTFAQSFLNRSWDNATAKPIMYDVLTIIFALTDSNFRQKHLQDILNYYYDTFKIVSEKLLTIVDINDLEYHLKILIPIVKLEAISFLIQTKQNSELSVYVSDLERYFKNPLLNKEDCIEAVSKKIGTREFDLLDYRLITLDECNGHLGEYFSLVSKVKYSGKIEDLKMFVKASYRTNEYLAALANSGPSKKEDFFYRTILTQFEKCGFKSLLDFTPNCYFSRFNDVLVLEDLIELGFKNLQGDTKLNYKEFKCIFVQCAKFHTLTILLEVFLSQDSKKPVYLNDVYNNDFEDWILTEKKGVPTTPVHPKNAGPGIHALIDYFPQFSKTISKENLKQKLDEIMLVMGKKFSFQKNYRNVICHGDLYASNIMLRESACMLVDYQGLRYGLPFQDIFLALYCHGEKKVRDKYFYNLLDDYYIEMQRILNEYNLKIENIYPLDQFKAAAEYMKPYSIVLALLYLQLLIVPQDINEELGHHEKFIYYTTVGRKEYVDRLLCWEDFKIHAEGLIQDLYECFEQ